ncbi:helix-turn-helix domain-containing protein [Paraclostridium bifermentans]|nr:helix-turn-helix domain-containing protein [Paraclostridium bifermentans]
MKKTKKRNNTFRLFREKSNTRSYEKCNGNMVMVSKLLNIGRSTLYRKLINII